MQSRCKAGSYFLSCSAKGSTEGEIGKTGLLAGHAYAVLNAVEAKGHKLMYVVALVMIFTFLANCVIHGVALNGRANGNTLFLIHLHISCRSDGASEWTMEMKKTLQVTFKDDGLFWMNYEDFCTYWTYIDCVYIFNDPSAKIKKTWFDKTILGEWKGPRYKTCAFYSFLVLVVASVCMWTVVARIHNTFLI